MVFGLVLLCSVCADYADYSSAGSCGCLAQCCRCGGFFPNYAVFALVLRISVLGYGILALVLIFLGCASGVAFLAPSAYPTLRPWPAGAGIVGFSCGPPLWWSLSVCGGPSGAAVMCLLLSSCSAQGRLMLCLLLGFASVPLPAAPAVF